MAIQAAFRDPRFSPLQQNEWKDIDIEISVLTPLKKIDDASEIEIGVHGLYIEKGAHSGLLLPQVATEQHWDRTAFLENTCFKAGLPKDAWKSKDAVIYIFSADVF
jgi:AmmeMemoRadiSam system protein A